LIAKVSKLHRVSSWLVPGDGYRVAINCGDFDRALTLLATVIRKTEGEPVVYAGPKSISGEHGVPVVRVLEGLRLRKLNAEHDIIDILDPWFNSRSAIPSRSGRITATRRSISTNACNSIRSGQVEEILKPQGADLRKNGILEGAAEMNHLPDYREGIKDLHRQSVPDVDRRRSEDLEPAGTAKRWRGTVLIKLHQKSIVERKRLVSVRFEDPCLRHPERTNRRLECSRGAAGAPIWERDRSGCPRARPQSPLVPVCTVESRFSVTMVRRHQVRFLVLSC
jgi:hypothetical protein